MGSKRMICNDFRLAPRTSLSPDLLEENMKVPALLVPVCLAFLAFGPACSRDDQTPGPSSSPKVVQTIQPLPEPKKAPEAEVKQPLEDPAQEKPSAGTMDAVVTAPSSAEKGQTPAEEKAKAPAKADQAEAGVYVVKKGDTLAGLAARDEIMQDPLKWLILLRLNRDKLGDQPVGADFAARELPPGMKLRFITPREAKEGVEKPPEPMWVVNVMSASDVGEVVPPAVILPGEGYPAYLTRAYVKGKDYLRLRVGFFPGKKEALEQGEKIKKLLGLEAFWATKVDDVEYKEVAGFLKTP
jgi:hypothetical protein